MAVAEHLYYAHTKIQEGIISYVREICDFISLPKFSLALGKFSLALGKISLGLGKISLALGKIFPIFPSARENFP